MINKSIAYKLSIYISLAVIGIFIVFIIVSFFFNQKLLRENIENRAIGLSTQINAVINQNVSVTQEVALNISEQAIYYAKNDDVDMLLMLVMEKYPFINAIHLSIDSAVALSNHEFLVSRKDGELNFLKSSRKIYNCSNELTVFKEIENNEEAGWTEPYRCQQSDIEIVAFYCPVFNFGDEAENEPLGRVICELSLTELNQSINELSPGERGYAFVVDKKGRYITHPDKKRILNQNIFKLPEKIVDPDEVDIVSIFSNNLTGSAIVYPEILDYEKSWVYYTPINRNRWYLIFIMPYNELFTPLYVETLRMLLFSVIGIIIIYFIVTYISERLVQPLSSVTRQLDKLSRPGSKESTNNEVEQVASSLNYLRTWFDNYKISQEQEELKNHRRRQDLMQASEIQQSLIKTDFQSFEKRNDIDLFALYKPARVVSGDLFDYFFADDENLVFTIGDVSGKGIPAAIFMSIVQTIIKNNASYKKAKNIVTKANQDLCTNNMHQFFVTLFLGILNVKKGELNYCNAAHTKSFILKTNGNITELNQSHGLPLGLYTDKNYKDSKIKLDKGDKIILYTDGVTELLNEEKQQFGTARLKEKLIPLKNLGPEKLVDQIETALSGYRGNAPQSDDICVFVIEYKK
jgi:sigma-B regulation protein RsbU (phosphoserine phosphatase)